MVSVSRFSRKVVYRYLAQGSVVSAIAGIITTIVTAIADIIIIIVNSIVTVSTSKVSTVMVLKFVLQVLVLIWDLFVDILCCRCCTSRRVVGTRRRFGSSPRY
jgi:hypothetical protein